MSKSCDRQPLSYFNIKVAFAQKLNMRDLLFYVVGSEGKHYFYDYERAVKYYDLFGDKMYAYTKDLFPVVSLLCWK